MMNEEVVFDSVIKVVTHNFGVSNDPEEAGESYQVDFLAPDDAYLILLDDTRFVTIGEATFLVGMPVLSFGGVMYSVLHDADMVGETAELSEIWISTHDIISIVEEVGRPEE